MSMAELTLRTVPQPLIALGIFLLLVGAYALGRWARLRRKNDSEKETARNEVRQMFDGFIVSAVLGLLALLLGFTFAMAVDRYDQRFAIEVDQANAIESTYLLAQTFDDPHGRRISDILRAYAGNQLRLAQSDTPDRARTLLAESDAMQTCLWSASLAAAHNLRDDMSATYLDSARLVIDTSARRVAVRLWHIPIRVHVVLLIYAIVTAYVLGSIFAAARQHLAAAALFGLVTLSMVLIIDLDRPAGGRIVESQQPLKAMIVRLNQNPPARYRSFETSQNDPPDSQAMAAGEPAGSSSEWTDACHYAEHRQQAGQ